MERLKMVTFLWILTYAFKLFPNIFGIMMVSCKQKSFFLSHNVTGIAYLDVFTIFLAQQIRDDDHKTLWFCTNVHHRADSCFETHNEACYAFLYYMEREIVFNNAVDC